METTGADSLLPHPAIRNEKMSMKKKQSLYIEVAIYRTFTLNLYLSDILHKVREE